MLVRLRRLNFVGCLASHFFRRSVAEQAVLNQLACANRRRLRPEAAAQNLSPKPLRPRGPSTCLPAPTHFF